MTATLDVLDSSVCDGLDVDLWAAVADLERTKGRSLQRKLGPSEIGDCLRYAAYRMAGVEKSDERELVRQAALGTWIHAGIEEVLRDQFGAITEVEVEDDIILGHIDAVWPLVIEDIKTRSANLMKRAEASGPERSELYQIHYYARLAREGRFSAAEKRIAGPQPIVDVRVRFVNRDNGDEHVWQRPYDPDIGDEAARWVETAAEHVDDPDSAPIDLPGPGLCNECDWCPFKTRCWGYAPEGTAPQTALIHDRADVEIALAEYDAARSDESEASKSKKFARAKLDDSDAGMYGPWELGWSGGGPGRLRPDVDAMIALLEEAGVPIPMRQAPSTSRSIVVRRHQ